MEAFEILKNRREEMGLSQEEVATIIGTSYEYYRKVELGHANLSETMANKLSEIYGVELTPYKVDYKPTPRPKGPYNKKKAKNEDKTDEDFLDEHHYKVLNKELKRINSVLLAELSRVYKLIADAQLFLDKVHEHIDGLFPKAEEDE